MGVEYPTDHMTWDEAIELAGQLTAERNGVQYRGLEMGSCTFPLKQLSVTLTDPKTGNVQLTEKPEFTQYMELLKLRQDGKRPSLEGPIIRLFCLWR